jgi:SAM-dependent methyltransferase
MNGAVAGGAYHWRAYGMDEFVPTSEDGRKVLLLGCGDGGERPHLEARGLEPVGLDVRASEGVDVLGDAHVLPFRADCFDGVLSMQVLEHLRAPWIAVEEVARVLRPGGWFVGSVAFLKPYHGSYFHMTHDGVRELLERAGLEADRFDGAQSLTYTLYDWLLPIGSRPLRRALLGALDRALLWLRAAAWRLTRGVDPEAPTDRFDARHPFSFRTFDRLRRAPAVVFRGHLPAGSG